MQGKASQEVPCVAFWRNSITVINRKKPKNQTNSENTDIGKSGLGGGEARSSEVTCHWKRVDSPCMCKKNCLFRMTLKLHPCFTHMIASPPPRLMYACHLPSMLPHPGCNSPLEGLRRSICMRTVLVTCVTPFFLPGLAMQRLGEPPPHHRPARIRCWRRRLPPRNA